MIVLPRLTGTVGLIVRLYGPTPSTSGAAARKTVRASAIRGIKARSLVSIYCRRPMGFLQRRRRGRAAEGLCYRERIGLGTPEVVRTGVFAPQIARMLVDAKTPTIFIRNLGVAAHLAGLLGP